MRKGLFEEELRVDVRGCPIQTSVRNSHWSERRRLLVGPPVTSRRTRKRASSTLKQVCLNMPG